MSARHISLFADNGNGRQASLFLTNEDKAEFIGRFDDAVLAAIGEVPDYEMRLSCGGSDPTATVEFAEPIEGYGNVSDAQFEKLAKMTGAFIDEPVAVKADFPTIRFTFAPGKFILPTRDAFPNRNKKKKVEPKEEPNEETKVEPKD